MFRPHQNVRGGDSSEVESESHERPPQLGHNTLQKKKGLTLQQKKKRKREERQKEDKEMRHLASET